ncbi:MAG: pyrroline-5-carboxylate reductase [archaeon]|nr:pyrroline-5-carboxylate reductase [archaeon]
MIGFIGFGKMGSALAKSLVKKGIAKSEIICFDPNKELIEKEGFVTAENSLKVAEKSETIFVCVKPNTVGKILEEIKPKVENQIVVSIAAGIKISAMKKALGKKKIVRVMPNICALAGEAACAFTSINLTKNEKTKVKELLENFGVAIEVEEKNFDGVTGLSGSGPAFVAYFLEAMAEAGTKNGLGKKEAYELALQTLIGTGKLLKESKMGTKELIEMVSSPNGTTIAGRKILEKGEFKKIIEKTITKAKEKSEELGKNE